MLWRAVQAWELLDPPSGWDTSGPVLATGYFHISNTALQMVMLIDDAMAQACHQGEQHQGRNPLAPLLGPGLWCVRAVSSVVCGFCICGSCTRLYLHPGATAARSDRQNRVGR